MRSRATLATAVLLGLLGGLAPAGPVWAAPPGGAAITLDRTSVKLGQRLFVSLAGFRTRNVDISVCGNLAMRGTVDCNLQASQALKLYGDPTVTELTIFAPPGTCPCVVRASSAEQDEVAVAPIEIVGVPTGPVVGPAGQQFIAVAATVSGAHQGLVTALRSALGGPTSYDLEVSLHNLAARRLSGLTITGSVRNGSSASVTSFDVAGPDALLPGATWVQRKRLTLPAPAIGSFSWRVTVSGVGAPASAQVVNRHVPLLLIVVVVVFVADLVAIAWRYVTTRLLLHRRPREVLTATAASSV